MRNAISYELWDRMGKIGTNSKFFEFLLNDVYMGLYVMFEKPKIDVPYRVPIEIDILDNESIDNNYDGGWMIKVESGAEQDFFIGYDSYTKYEYYDPKLEIESLQQLVECKDDSELDGNLYDTLIECLQSNCGDCDDEDFRCHKKMFKKFFIP